MKPTEDGPPTSLTVSKDALQHPADGEDVAPDAKPSEPLAGKQSPRRWLRGVSRTVLVLGAVSLMTDISSEMIMPLRLLFLVQVLGTPLILASVVEGAAEGATSILKVISGTVADRINNRRWLVIAGYSVSNLAKPLLAWITTWQLALGLVLVDRAGKSVRGSPRDAMIADSVQPDERGKAFGFHRSADTLGAAIGPLLAVAILGATAGDLRAVFAWTLIPGVLAIIFAVLFLRDPRRRAVPHPPVSPARNDAQHVVVSAEPRVRAWQGLGARFWLFVVVATIFALGNSSDAFLFLRTEGLEASLVAVPLVYFGFNLVYAVLATPLGALSDRFGRMPVLALGYAAFTLVYLGWTRATASWHIWGLFLLYGAYYAATEGVAKAFVSDLVPKPRRGTALGWYNGLTGFIALPANLLAAWLWTQVGPTATFGLGAWMGAIALGLLVAWWPWLKPNGVPWPQDPEEVERRQESRFE
jgi:MFS family permease